MRIALRNWPAFSSDRAEFGVDGAGVDLAERLLVVVVNTDLGEVEREEQSEPERHTHQEAAADHHFLGHVFGTPAHRFHVVTSVTSVPMLTSPDQGDKRSDHQKDFPNSKT